MRLTERKNLFLMLIALPLLFCSCGSGDDSLPTKEENDNKGEEPTIIVNPVTDLKGEETQNANELKVTWQNPKDPRLIRVELSYALLTEGTENEPLTQQVNATSGSKGSYLLKLAQYGNYEISAVAIDNYGKRSEKVTITATPSKTGFVIDWSALADSCTYVLIEQFMNKNKGTFWKSPKDISGGSFNIYWQQAHAMDVVVYSYERIKDENPDLANTYKRYFKLWFENKANNYHHSASDETGFLNPFTDDMCWICLTMIHLSEATGDDTYINMAKKIYDQHIITRAWTDNKGTGLPWQTESNGRNACTNSPGCLIAVKLYKKFNKENYLTDAKTLYKYIESNLLKDDGRVEEPPLTYTQGTFGEACRQLYHVTQEVSYMRMAEKVINYTATSSRCLRNGILRDEGTSMDQSIFKAVFVPYAINLILDDKALSSIRTSLRSFMKENAKTLRNNLNRKKYPAMYCDYYWGSIFSGDVASMGAQASGASLMEGIARMLASENNPE